MRISVETVAKVILARHKGKTYEAIASEQGLAVKSVYVILKGRNLQGAAAVAVFDPEARDLRAPTPAAFVKKIEAELRRRSALRYAAA